jgi:hypothetical protein
MIVDVLCVVLLPHVHHEDDEDDEAGAEDEALDQAEGQPLAAIHFMPRVEPTLDQITYV